MNERRANKLFGSFVIAFEFMDAKWRMGVLNFLVIINEWLNEKLLEEEK